MCFNISLNFSIKAIPKTNIDDNEGGGGAAQQIIHYDDVIKIASILKI